MPLAEPGDLRLSNAVTSGDGKSQYGRLQVFGSGGWGTVCDPRPPFINILSTAGDQEVDQETVRVACRGLGFESGVKTAIPVRRWEQCLAFTIVVVCRHITNACIVRSARLLLLHRESPKRLLVSLNLGTCQHLLYIETPSASTTRVGGPWCG